MKNKGIVGGDVAVRRRRRRLHDGQAAYINYLRWAARENWNLAVKSANAVGDATEDINELRLHMQRLLEQREQRKGEE